MKNETKDKEFTDMIGQYWLFLLLCLHRDGDLTVFCTVSTRRKSILYLMQQER